ncbi:polymer biosynthesis protein, WecB/TagA/CpsF family [Methylobacterium sp. 174MFSha1.1]|uniref:WecB/TagA/CpsF family glycosyltransferase n=1 Tax=Methylobacterium sp. 174MFSha1.1 TaxID=1502749 RepID=UPI0008F2EF5C|nr:WecB/TagA/CpsF family glycosyltransferase [Methylobacterium sp. 174MFSha1.1]SFV16220.1 polymer biosynthesis protein, WecB/TagA/CpsF family [Methylobacterium sp. 174MFSha1.1]
MKLATPKKNVTFLGVPFTNIDRATALAEILEGTPSSPLMVVTPNAQHVGVLHKDHILREHYLSADLILNDSKVLALLARFVGINLTVVTGSDLTAALLPELERRGGKVLIIGPRQSDGMRLNQLYPKLKFDLLSPSFQLRDDVEEQNRLVESASHGDAGILLVALGFPMQEKIAWRISKTRNKPCYILCIGGSVDFLTGQQRRAPAAMQRLHLEWLFRLLSSPRRMWRRYFVESAPVLWLFLIQLIKWQNRR